MNLQPLREQLRLAFSYAETAAKLRTENAADAERHLKRSGAAITRVRKSISDEARRLGKREGAILSKARRSPKQAASAQAELSEIRRTLGQCSDLLAATSSRTLGGPVELPVDAYPRRLRRTSSPVPLSSPLYNLPIAFLGVLALVGLYLFLTRDSALTGDVEIHAETLPNQNAVVVQWVNQSAEPVFIHVPWLEGERSSAPEGHFGVDVYVQEGNDATFRLAPPVPEAWRRPFATGRLDSAYELSPGLSLEVLFNPGALRRQGLNVTRYRIECTDRRGRVRLQFDGP